MIKHIVLFRFKDDVPNEKKTGLLNEYQSFSEEYPAMRSFDIGWNRSERDDRFEVGFVVEFGSEDELKAYLNSESHEQHVRERFRPLIAERAIVSFEYDPGTQRVRPVQSR